MAKIRHNPPPHSRPFDYRPLVVAIAVALGRRPAHERFYGVTTDG